MSPGVGGRGTRGKARGWRAVDQARLLLPCILLAALPACTERIWELDPRPTFDNIFNAAHLEGREPPPGLDAPFPNLSTVPPRPAPPDAAGRARLDAALVADREASRSPLGVGSASPRAPAAEGPPAPPRLAAVPVIPREPPVMEPAAPTFLPPSQPAPAPRQEPAAVPVAPATPAPATPTPAAPTPAAPAPAAPPPPPSRDLFAPPPPPPADMLAPRRS
jgi:hypothetical protein